MGNTLVWVQEKSLSMLLKRRLLTGVGAVVGEGVGSCKNKTIVEISFCAQDYKIQEAHKQHHK
jgi:hypothetical protein